MRHIYINGPRSESRCLRTALLANAPLALASSSSNLEHTYAVALPVVAAAQCAHILLASYTRTGLHTVQLQHSTVSPTKTSGDLPIQKCYCVCIFKPPPRESQTNGSLRKYIILSINRK